jgi:uncharacterized membrane protein
MEILYFNVLWMAWNSFLAILPVGFAWLYFKTSRKFYKAILAICWFLFLPNALYIVSDLEHLVQQWPMVEAFERIVLVIQYIHLEVIGLTAFLFNLYAFEKELRRLLKKNNRRFISAAIISVNFLTGFAIVVGKVERVNSWDVIVATDKVLSALIDIIRWDHLVWLAILFGLFGNFFYYLFRDPVIKFARKQLKNGVEV